MDAQRKPADSARGGYSDPPSGLELLARLKAMPGAPELLELAGESSGIHLVGGAVRDLLLGRTPRELDVLVEEQGGSFGDRTAQLARSLAAQLHASAQPNEHERFGTAIVRWEGGRIDIATARRERYPLAGELPKVGPARIAEDLERRDFTINAIALALAGPDRGKLLTARGTEELEDLRNGLLRVLHDASFIDDPTRLLRLARYSARLGFQVEQSTSKLAERAIGEHRLSTVSGARIGAELRLAINEAGAVQSVAQLQGMHLLSDIHPRLRLDERLFSDALELLPTAAGRPEMLLLACLVLPLTVDASSDPGWEARTLLDRLEFAGSERDLVIAAALSPATLAERLTATGRASVLRRGLYRAPLEGVALAGALAGEQGMESARRWLDELRHIRLLITGDDLLAHGIPSGPDIGRRLEVTLDMRLDGELPDEREAQLQAALRA